MSPPTESYLDFALPISWPVVAVICLALAIGVALSYRFARVQTPRAIRLGAGVLRWLACCAVLFMILRPQHVHRQKAYPPGQVAVLLDDSASMQTRDAHGTRIQAAKSWIESNLAKLPKRCQPSWFGFSTELAAVQDVTSLAAKGKQSRLSRALGEVLDYKFPGTLRSVIVLSDGEATPPNNFDRLEARFHQRRIPVYAVAVGDVSPKGDVAIEEARPLAPAVAHLRSSLAVKLWSGGFRGAKTELVVSEAGKEIKRVPLTLEDGSQEVRVKLNPLKAGFHVLSLAIPPQPGEQVTSNNTYEMGLDVADETVRVLYMEGTGTQQGVFQPLILKQALDAMPGIEAKTLYADQYGGSPLMRNKVAYIDPKTGDRIYRVQHDTKGYPKTMKDLLHWDVIINSDIPVSAFSNDQLEMTAKFVTQYGGGFIMVGGHTAFGAGGYHRTVINKLIPVEMQDFDAALQDTFKPVVAPGAWDHPLLQVADTKAEIRHAWTEAFPPLFGYNVVIREKPGAVRLLEHPTRRNQYGPLIILACQEVGAGRSMAFTSDTTFYWGMEFEDIWGEPTSDGGNDRRYYRNFWANAVRWLSANKKRMERSGLTIDPLPGAVPPNSTVTVSVKAALASPTNQNEPVIVELLRNENDVVVSKAASWNANAKRFQADLTIPSQGSYRVRARRGEAAQAKAAEALLICRNQDWEHQELRARPDLLKSLAEGTGGRLLPDSALPRGELLSLLAGKSAPVVHESRFPIGKPVYWLLLIIALLGGEWLLRRLNRMA